MIELGIYKHYKGNLYEVVGIAKHSESLLPHVVYKALYQTEGENLWVRPLQMFQEEVVVDGVSLKRFARVV